jgi:rRNA maturation protein Nop10
MTDPQIVLIKKTPELDLEYAVHKAKWTKYTLETQHCRCGGKYSHYTKARHVSTNKHIKYLISVKHKKLISVGN